jgi:murein DD-endopeptidase MepM/ murein hydrolase activator NlpD
MKLFSEKKVLRDMLGKVRLSIGWRKNKPSTNPFYTLLILPHSCTRFRKLQVSRGFMLCMAGLLAVALVAGLGAPHLFFKVISQATDVDKLVQDNRRLRESTASFESALAEISERLDGFEERSERMAALLGVEELTSGQPSGGPGEGSASSGRGQTLFDQELEAVRKRASYLDRSLEQLDEAFQERLRFLSSTPSIMPVQGWFSHGFGWRKDPMTGKRQFHRGIDIVADSGTPIRAPADGVITRTARVADYGKMIDMSHGFGYSTRYGHMSEILVREGQKVRRGDVIGRIGSTGRSTGPHLHYEVFRDGRRVNPWKYLGQKGR